MPDAKTEAALQPVLSNFPVIGAISVLTLLLPDRVVCHPKGN